ncbi:MAG: DUF3256 family protein [Candidatus Symbiothrix sp.]|nr:DUF3256 family protein [Candidatus Symbiothrix sp.]
MKIMKGIIVLVVSLGIAISLNAQTAKEFFVLMPDEMLLDLNRSGKMDLVDLYEAGREAAIVNKLGDTLLLEKLTPDYLLLNTGKSSLQIVVLSMLNESQLYCFIQTACGPVCDSRVEFYSPSWKKLNAEAFITPAPPAWFIQANADFAAPAVSFMQWLYDPDTSTLQQINRTPDYLSEEDRRMIQPYITKESRDYHWNGIRFE